MNPTRTTQQDTFPTAPAVDARGPTSAPGAGGDLEAMQRRMSARWSDRADAARATRRMRRAARAASNSSLGKLIDCANTGGPRFTTVEGARNFIYSRLVRDPWASDTSIASAAITNDWRDILDFDEPGVLRLVREIRHSLPNPPSPSSPPSADEVPVTGALNGGDLLAEQPPPHDPILDDVFDFGSVVEVIGPSKTRKSYLTLQLSLGLASGRNVLGLTVRNPVSVLLVNLELTASDQHRRLWRMGRTLGISKADVGTRLTVLNLRDELEAGKASKRISDAVNSGRFQVIIIDPVYPLLDGPENAPETWAPLTATFNRWATQCGAVIYVHHDGKGEAGERNIRDRGAGSSITGRNAYARLCITPQKTDPENTIVLDFMLRGYAPHAPVAITFRDDAFHSSDLPAHVLTSSDRRSRREKLDPATVLALVKDGPLRATVFMARLQALGVAEKRARAVRDELLQEGTIETFKHGFQGISLIGLPSAIRAMREESKK